MIDVAWLEVQDSTSFFGAASHHVAVNLDRVTGARVLWVNQKAAALDPHFDRVKRDIERYEAHLLSCCAFTIANERSGAEEFGSEVTTGYADRYGGSGIGQNGGSGRAVVINGYLVKGVGRTPLVSALTDVAHASGGAYLEECIRETIYSEIVSAEFPCSAVPVLAIIDIDELQVFQTPDGPIAERRTLLVRPCFIRPAHFERATGYFSGNPKEGMQDTARVDQFFAQAVALMGKAQLVEHYKALWMNWSKQLAYAFVHRLPHGSNTISNVCLDGKLLDFGAMSALPSWADARLMEARENFGAQFNLLAQMIRSTGYYFNRYLATPVVTQDNIAGWVATVQSQYVQVFIAETLRLCGLSRAAAIEVMKAADFTSLWQAIGQIIRHFQRERIDMVESTPVVRLEWDLHKIWDQRPPPHLLALQTILKPLLGPSELSMATKRCRLISATRSSLFREEVKRDIFATVDRERRGEDPSRDRIERYINEQVAQGRRDHRLMLDDVLPIGFAVGSLCSYVLFQETDTDRIFAIRESYSGRGEAMSPATHDHRLFASDMSETWIRFEDRNQPDFEGAVKLHRELM